MDNCVLKLCTLGTFVKCSLLSWPQKSSAPSKFAQPWASSWSMLSQRGTEPPSHILGDCLKARWGNPDLLKSEPPVEQTQNTGDPRKRQPARPTTHQALSHLPRQQPTLSTFLRPQSTLSASLPSDLNHTSPRTSILHQALVCMFFPKGLRLLLLLSRFSRVWL